MRTVRNVMSLRAAMAATVLVTGLLLGAGGPVGAAPPGGPGTAPTGAAAAAPLPPGWQLSIDRGRPVLTWQAPRPVPMGDAAVEFFAGERLLGRPRATSDGRAFRLELPAAAGELVDLQVRAAGRRLDATGSGTRRRGQQTTPPAPGAPAPAHPVDPGVAGPYRTTEGEYALPSVKLPDFPEPVEMRAVVVGPQGAPGARPLVLLLHGRHSTCFAGPDPEKLNGDWPCRAGTEPIPSHRGYLQSQRLLASQGYVTVSISANGVNGQDFPADDYGAQARSSLVRLHLGKWADWAGSARASAPPIVRAAPRVDLSRVLLMGHSRGGEGVNRAAMDSLRPPPAAADGYRGAIRWKIRGTVLIGPTVFGDNPAADVPSVTLLPGCDGDVSDLQGQRYIDGPRGVSRGAALHSSLYVVGANHNFFNTEWTPGQAVAPAADDFPESVEDPDPVCDPVRARTRLTAAQQQTVGATYLAAAARLFVAGDDRVRPLLDGTGVRAPSADPARVLSHATGAARIPLVLPDRPMTVSGPGARLCQVATDELSEACYQQDDAASPHFVLFEGLIDPDRRAVLMQWSTADQAIALRSPAPVSIAGAGSLALRIAVPPNTVGTRFGVGITDANGRHSELGEIRLDGLPGSASTAAAWAQEIRLPLAGAQVDLRSIVDLRLVPRSGAGKAWLMDAWGWRPGTPAPRPAPLARVDIGTVRVDEGHAGSRTYRIPVDVSGRGTGQVRLFMIDPLTYETTSRLVTVRRGDRSISVPVDVTGDSKYGADERHQVLAKAVSGAEVGSYIGGLHVNDDDPMPAVTVAPVADRVVEGSPLTWRITSSATTEDGLYVFFEVQPPAGGEELSSTDVDPRWFEGESGEDPLPSRPLSDTRLLLFTGFGPDELTTDVTVPTVVDQLAEPEEHLKLQMQHYSDEFGGLTPGAVVTGTVRDHP